jgi:CelD/BcsL family acetyltransferase involved in cellulose biosynthesis
MTLRPLIIDPLADPRWQQLVAHSADGGIFHHAQWLRLLRAQYGYRMQALCVADAGGEILAGVPFAHIRSRLTGNRLVALPFSDLCPPVFAGPRRAEALDVLASEVQATHLRDGFEIEVRGPIGEVGRPGKSFYHHEVPLESDADAMLPKFSSMVRRGIARARRDGVEVARGTGVKDLDEFYRLHVHTRRRQGVPTQPKRFIRRFAGLFEQDLGFVLLARSEGEAVAAAVYLVFNGVLVYKYGASAPEHLRKRPNHAIFAEAIRWGCEHGQRSLDLGRTDLDNEGLRAFKRAWGGLERRVAYTSLSRAQEQSSGVAVPRYLKTLISRTPSFTGRVAGAALYKHFG